MKKYLESINHYNEVNKETIEELEIKTLSILEDEYDERDTNLYGDYGYFEYIETVIYQLARNKPELSNYTRLVSELYDKLEKDKNNLELEDLYYEVIEDIKLIESLYYTDFISNLPIKYFNDEIALRTYFNDYLDYLNKDGNISDYTVDNIDFDIVATNIEDIS